MIELEEAEASYRKAIAIKPDYAQAYSNLGANFKKLGKLEEAEATSEKQYLGPKICIKPIAICA